MPRRRKKAVRVDAAEGEEVVSSFKYFGIDKSQTVAYTLCPEAAQKMRYRLLVCSPVRAASQVRVAQEDRHVPGVGARVDLRVRRPQHSCVVPRRKKLTTTQMAFCREVAENHLRSIRAVELRVTQRAGNTG
ncbi:hypothetical protein PR003_g16484 [Phytophthora rubi]|uniref:Uncharacterized protein n=1 Tax=Phytophthora rubi TaxID=129364 RepID=A0A6A3LBX1_9STRA|nr:hypothetical protein PR002_g16120 [Phytophthora rubi]KAE9013333.1 hypothetical protein PR001_g15434 [Phytophthora rubi]KAE9325417.1 hypothetical protein PR003_g16484 [Phytophthora rubi]